jgi:hypothetical protein
VLKPILIVSLGKVLARMRATTFRPDQLLSEE